MRVLILSVVFALTSSAKVTWLPDTSFNLPLNFKDGNLPCSKQTVVFPDTLQGAVRFQSESFAKEFILPSTGEMLLEGALYLGANPKDACVEQNSYFIDKTLSSWASPDVWASPRFNEATPDAEKVPCSDDTVEFPTNAMFSILLPEVTQSIQGLILKGRDYSTGDLFRYYALNPVDDQQQFFLNSFSDSGIVIEPNKCRSQATKGCPCQLFALEVDCTLKFCALPTCSSPIKPIGHCCKICGGAISFERDESFNYLEFKEFVDRTVTSYKDNNIVYHIGIIPPNKVQVVVAEKGEYTGSSALVANDIDSNLLRHWYEVKAVSLSGGPLSDSGSGLKIAVCVFFIVTLLFGGVYVWHYKIPTPTINLPSFPSMGRGSAAGLLSRFDRRTESIVSLTRRDSAATVASTAGVSTAFRNPLYSSKRGRVDVVESVIEDDNIM